jgi:hypothetical protein
LIRFRFYKVYPLYLSYTSQIKGIDNHSQQQGIKPLKIEIINVAQYPLYDSEIEIKLEYVLKGLRLEVHKI